MRLLFAIAIMGQISSGGPIGDLSPEATKLIAPIQQACMSVDAQQARLPAPTTVTEKLERLLVRDQAGRTALAKVDLSSLPEPERKLALSRAMSLINARDVIDQQELKALIPRDGWFKKSIYGKTGTKAAFLIVQHAGNDPALMQRTLVKIGQYVKIGEADGDMYALMYDRVALTINHGQQRYGTQVDCSSGIWAPFSLEDPPSLDKRRAAIGLSSETSYLAHFAGEPCR